MWMSRLIIPQDGPRPAATNDEIERLADAIARYHGWQLRQQALRDEQADERRLRRQQKGQQRQANHDEEAA